MDDRLRQAPVIFILPTPIDRFCASTFSAAAALPLYTNMEIMKDMTDMWPKGRINWKATEAELQAEIRRQRAMMQEWRSVGRTDMSPLNANIREIERELIRRRAPAERGVSEAPTQRTPPMTDREKAIEAMADILLDECCDYLGTVTSETIATKMIDAFLALGVTIDMRVAAMTSLAMDGIPPDTQALLTGGDVSRGIKPGALARAIAAALKTLEG
jgi:hypothetical protein